MINVTAAMLRKLAPTGNQAIINSLVGPINTWAPIYSVTTKNRMAHFLAQICWESDHFKTFMEYASGAAYEGRKDLGNIYKGDGVRFKGRGPIQCTGRANYRAYGDKLGIDLIANPQLAATPEIGIRIAFQYWKDKGLNGWADRDDGTQITIKINGGKNGLAGRLALVEVAKRVLAVAAVAPTPPPAELESEPEVHELPPAPDTPVARAPFALQEETPDAPIAAEASKPWYKSTETLTAGGGILGAIGGLSQSQWGFITVVFLVIAFALGFWIYERQQREALERPTIPKKKLLDPPEHEDDE